MNSLKRRLASLPPAAFSLYAIVAAFGTYACMYAFRKPFAAATFAGEASVLGLDYKSFLVIAQIIGYMLSKFIGIKVVSEMDSKRRVLAILLLIGIAWLALLGFGMTPAPYNAGFLFLNGLPLGMIWGLVFSFLEGRRATEVMGLGLCASFIFSSGFVKDIGRWVMTGWGVSEVWMPFVTGALFALPLLLFVALLSLLPPPNAEDEAERTPRGPMDGKARWQYFLRFAPGLILLVAVYTLITAYRDFRDNFMADIYLELVGAEEMPSFSGTETWVSIGTLLVLMLIVLVKDNLRALLVNHLAVLLGVLLAGGSTYAHGQGWISPWTWILLTGFGTYFAYIPFNSILFDRMIATYQQVANVGFLIYVADSFGYLGSVGVLLYKNFSAAEMSWARFFTLISYLLAGLGMLGMILSALYFWRKSKQN
jgi:hypothetical protein